MHNRLASMILLAALLGVAPTASEAEDEAAWTEIKTTEGAHEELAACRSLTILHERRVPVTTPWAWAGAALIFERAPGDTWALTWSHPEHSPKPRTIKPSKPGPQAFWLKALGTAGMLAAAPDPVGPNMLVVPTYAVALRVGKHTAWLVDSDMDGTLGSAGDGLVAPGSRTVAPWRAEIYTPLTGIRVRRTEGGGWEQTLLGVPYPENADHTAAWRLLQWKRQQCGLLPVAYKTELEPAIRLHADYCVENGYQGHVQDPKGKAYTKAGAVAGMQCVLGYEVKTVLEGIGQQFATLYHRNGLLQPGLTHTAMAVHRGVFGANVRDAADGPLKACILLYPPHGMEDVDLRFYVGGENPMPVANRLAGIQNLGTSVGLFAGPFEQQHSLTEKPQLSVAELIGAKRRVGSSFRLDLHYPGNIPNERVHFSNFGNVALTPPRPLEKKTTYRCRIRTPLPPGVTLPWGPAPAIFEHEWEFSTGP